MASDVETRSKLMVMCRANVTCTLKTPYYSFHVVHAKRPQNREGTYKFTLLTLKGHDNGHADLTILYVIISFITFTQNTVDKGHAHFLNFFVQENNTNLPTVENLTARGVRLPISLKTFALVNFVMS